MSVDTDDVISTARDTGRRLMLLLVNDLLAGDLAINC